MLVLLWKGVKFVYKLATSAERTAASISPSGVEVFTALRACWAASLSKSASGPASSAMTEMEESGLTVYEPELMKNLELPDSAMTVMTPGARVPKVGTCCGRTPIVPVVVGMSTCLTVMSAVKNSS